MRVLHLIDAGRPRMRELARARPGEGFDDRALSCGLVCELTRGEFDHHVCIVGSGRAANRARRLGLRPQTHICPTLGSLRFASGSIAKLITAVRPDLVHWWGPGWTGGCFGRPGKAWRLEVVMGVTPLGLPVWLCGGAAIVCGPEEGRWAAQAGLGSVVEAISPVFPAIGGHTPRPSTLSKDAPLTVLLLGPGADAKPLGFMCGVVAVVGRSLNPVAEIGAVQVARTRRLQHTLPGDARITIDNRPRSELLQEADVAVWMGGQGSPMVSIASAMASGIPVIAPPIAAALFPESIRSMCVALNSNVPELTRKLLALFDNPALTHAVARAAQNAIDVPARNLAFAQTIAAAWRGKVGGAPTAPAA